MYSVVLMAALAAGSQNPNHGCYGCYGCDGCNGCFGCGGGWFSCSCACSGCGGCQGWHVMTFAGNMCHGPYDAFAAFCIGSTHSMHARYGNFSVYAPYGYCNGCVGCYGCSCVGCSCFGCSCVGCSCVGCSCFGCSCSGCFGCTGCYGCYGGWSCYGAALPHHGHVVECPPAAPEAKDKKKDAKEKDPGFEETPLPKQKSKEKKELKDKDDEDLVRAAVVPAGSVRARVLIDLPANARLYIDGMPTKATTARRIFETPDLVPGATYFYDLRAEVTRDSQTVSQQLRVLLRAGQTATAAFPDVQNRATATVQYVNP